ncbi:MAG: phosphogluconate dehydrogenase (NADP(+)-dependent, decarboxylating) [Desulfobulbus sp.]|nr:MAG: phosphogluconate dehydrogenase (NADP(+)-dependent, decarboxylating) [Desulfobulbus sp.]
MSGADIGLVGLAVMGQNLVLNFNDHGYTVAAYNRTSAKIDAFLSGPAKNTQIIGAYSLEELVAALERPRKVMLMVKAGQVVDSVIKQLIPLLEEGDIIIDGGNSRFTDTERRTNELAEKGLLFIGTGISGGEEGARTGPSIMPGGNPAAWPFVEEMFKAIAAKVNNRSCCEWVGRGGAGHYVKMVHNGIEYGDMQLICEAYDFMQRGLSLDVNAMQAIFTQWKTGVLDSYLMEITANIFGYRDENGSPLIESIVDRAGQKGTGKWTGISALQLGVPLTLIGEAVFARCLSAMKEERIRSSSLLSGPIGQWEGDVQSTVSDLQSALYGAKIISYAQGYMLMREADRENNWNLNYGAIALMWRGGCIIRSVFLDNIKQAFDKNPGLENLLLDDFFSSAIEENQEGWRKIIILATKLGVPMPAMSSGLNFYDGYRSDRLPANLLQAQRDYFGAHTYERLDKPHGTFFHTDWTGKGGKVASSTYSV